MKPYLIDDYEITTDGLEVLFYKKEWTQSADILISWPDFERLLTAACLYDDIYDEYYTMYEDEDSYTPELDFQKVNENLHAYDVKLVLNYYLDELFEKQRQESWCQPESKATYSLIRELDLTSFLNGFLGEFQKN